MEKNSKNKNKTMSNDLALKLNGKSLFIQSNFCKYFFDANNSGDLFLNINERLANQKWEFQIADLPGFYFIKNIATGLFFSSNDFGDIFCNVLDPYSSYQRWRINLTSEPDCYVILNVGNDFILSCNKLNKLLLKEFDKKLFEKLEMPFAFLMFSRKPEKR